MFLHGVSDSSLFTAITTVLEKAFAVCDTLTDAGERAAVVAGTVVRRTVDGCRPADATTARDAKSTTAADDRRHRTVVLRQTHS